MLSMTPLEVIKARLQAQEKANYTHERFRGMFQSTSSDTLLDPTRHIFYLSFARSLPRAPPIISLSLSLCPDNGENVVLSRSRNARCTCEDSSTTRYRSTLVGARTLAGDGGAVDGSLLHLVRCYQDTTPTNAASKCAVIKPVPFERPCDVPALHSLSRRVRTSRTCADARIRTTRARFSLHVNSVTHGVLVFCRSCRQAARC